MGAQGPTLARLIPALVFLAIAGVLAYGLRAGDPSKLPSMLIGKSAPAAEFPALPGLDANGTQVPGFTSADLAKGRPTIVNFWASWCAQCVDEHPLLEKLAAETGVAVYGVNYKDSNEAARRYLSRYGNPYAAVGTDATGRSAINWGVYGMPETFIVSGNGTIVYKQVGAITEEAIRNKLQPAIAAAKAASGTAEAR